MDNFFALEANRRSVKLPAKVVHSFKRVLLYARKGIINEMKAVCTREFSLTELEVSQARAHQQQPSSLRIAGAALRDLVMTARFGS